MGLLNVCGVGVCNELTRLVHPAATFPLAASCPEDVQTGAITTLGRGGSDLTCTLIGAALGLKEVQVRPGMP